MKLEAALRMAYALGVDEIRSITTLYERAIPKGALLLPDESEFFPSSKNGLWWTNTTPEGFSICHADDWVMILNNDRVLVFASI